MQAPMGRGGVVALNNLRASGVLTLAGQFIGNRWGLSHVHPPPPSPSPPPTPSIPV
jgi:hypothetical protein